MKLSKRLPKILSIDIDYFDEFDYPKESDLRVRYLEEALRVLKESVWSLDDVIFIRDHHKILNFLDDYTGIELLNVDFHSDFCSNCDQAVCYGTWNRFVMCQENSVFRWYHPHNRDNIYRGYCSDVDVFKNNNSHSWKTAEEKSVTPYGVNYLIETGGFDKIFVVESSDYSSDILVECLRSFMKENNVKFSGGKRSEKLNSYIRRRRKMYKNCV